MHEDMQSLMSELLDYYKEKRNQHAGHDYDWGVKQYKKYADLACAAGFLIGAYRDSGLVFKLRRGTDGKLCQQYPIIFSANGKRPTEEQEVAAGRAIRGKQESFIEVLADRDAKARGIPSCRHLSFESIMRQARSVTQAHARRY